MLLPQAIWIWQVFFSPMQITDEDSVADVQVSGVTSFSNFALEAVKRQKRKLMNKEDARKAPRHDDDA